MTSRPRLTGKVGTVLTVGKSALIISPHPMQL